MLYESEETLQFSFTYTKTSRFAASFPGICFHDFTMIRTCKYLHNFVQVISLHKHGAVKSVNIF